MRWLKHRLRLLKQQYGVVGDDPQDEEVDPMAWVPKQRAGGPAPSPAPPPGWTDWSDDRPTP